MLSTGLVGVFMAVVLLGLITFGRQQHDSVNVGISMAFTAFAFFRIVGTFESRSATGTVFKVATFDCKQIDCIVIGGVVLALLATQWDLLQKLLGTVALHQGQWALSVVPALALLVLWEAGKLIARARGGKDEGAAEAAASVAAGPPPAAAHVR